MHHFFAMSSVAASLSLSFMVITGFLGGYTECAAVKSKADVLSYWCVVPCACCSCALFGGCCIAGNGCASKFRPLPSQLFYCWGLAEHRRDLSCSNWHFLV